MRISKKKKVLTVALKNEEQIVAVNNKEIKDLRSDLCHTYMHEEQEDEQSLIKKGCFEEKKLDMCIDCKMNIHGLRIVQ